MTVASADWLEVKQQLPNRMADLCDYAAEIEERIGRIARGLEREEFDVMEFSRLMADSKFALEYISIMRPSAPGGNTKLVEELIEDFQQTFKVMDDPKERSNLKTTINQKQGYGQVYLYMQKLIELLHGYFYRSLMQAKHTLKPNPDEYYMQQFAKAATEAPPQCIEHKEVNWKHYWRNRPKDLRRMCELADDLQYLTGIRRRYEWPAHTNEIYATAIALASEYLEQAGKRNDKISKVKVELARMIERHTTVHSQANATALAKEIMHGKVHAAILYADGKYEDKFMGAFVIASLDRRGLAPVMETKEEGGGITIEKPEEGE